MKIILQVIQRISKHKKENTGIFSSSLRFMFKYQEILDSGN